MKNKQGKFDTWILRLKLMLLQMNVFTAENVDENVLEKYWRPLHKAGCSPMEAIREQGLYRHAPMIQTREYEKYIEKLCQQE